jgi:hypothetical protein
MAQQMEAIDAHMFQRGQHISSMIGHIGGGGQVIGHAVSSQIQRHHFKVLIEQGQLRIPLTGTSQITVHQHQWRASAMPLRRQNLQCIHFKIFGVHVRVFGHFCHLFGTATKPRRL